VTVGLGIGATTTIFGAVYAALLRQLPYQRPDQLVRIYTDAPPNKFRFSVVDYLALQAEQTHFAQVAGYTGRQMAFSDGIVAERINGKEVSWSYFSLLGIKPVLGSDFAEADGRPGGPRRVIVSDGFWRRRLGGRMDAVGRSVRLDGTDFTLTGVLPSATGPLERDLEFFTAAQWAAPQRKGPFFIIAMGRLRDGATRAAATEELHAITRRLFPIWRSSYQDERATWGLMDLQTYIVGDVRTMAGLALSAVGLVWLIACANASNLLIARVTGRRRELAVRAALGASRGRVVRYLLAESALLALGAGALGIGLASIGTRLWRDLAVDYFPRAREIALDGPALAVLAALTGISILLFGLVPAAHGSGGSRGFAGGTTDDPLRSMGRAATASTAVRRLRRVLVGSQFAIATPLLIVAGLFLATLSELGRVDLGFDTHNLATGSITLPAPQYGEAGRARAFWTEVRRRVEVVPGVSAVAFADGRPPNDVGNFNNFDLEDMPARPGRSQPVTPWVAVSPEYFRLLGLSLLEGRLLEERDGIGEDLLAVVVDRAWAKRFFPNQSAIGKRFRSGGCTTCPWTSVVGVVTEVKYAGLDKPDEGSVYTALPPDERERYLFVRSAVDPATVMPAVRQILRELDPSLPFSQVATMDELTADALQTPRSLAWLVGVLASVALLLSVIGIYGVMAYYVQQHAKDISIRLALGANPGGVMKLVVGQGMAVVAGGVAVGAIAAFAATRLIAALLFRVSAADPRTFVAVAALLSFVGLVACLVPARRATALEPAVVLRNE
jgi:putative ABC transport system permease protein